MSRPRMRKVRKCDSRCHNAKHSRCKCWCGGAFHGVAGANNRQSVEEGVTELLQQNGFVQGQTAYIHQVGMKL